MNPANAAPAKPLTATSIPVRDAHAQLRRMSRELEGMFVAQLFHAMRASVPSDGLIPPAPGQEQFTSMLDDRLASEAAKRLRGGMSEALYRQLARRLPDAGPTP
jgi:flagellar protein FlgJ